MKELLFREVESDVFGFLLRERSVYFKHGVCCRGHCGWLCNKHLVVTNCDFVRGCWQRFDCVGGVWVHVPLKNLEVKKLR